MEKEPQGTNQNGSERHRQKTKQKGHEYALFEKLYRISRPVIRKLYRQIDLQKFNVTRDIIESYFWDKMLFIFNKYYGTCTEDHLRARILGGLTTFKNHLLHSAYTERAEFNQSLHSFEDLFEDSNEDKVDEEPEISDDKMIKMVNDYMMKNLYPDAQLVYEAIFTPPPFIREYPGYKDGNRITNRMLIDFFNLPRDTNSERYIRELREDIDYWIERAIEDLHL